MFCRYLAVLEARAHEGVRPLHPVNPSFHPAAIAHHPAGGNLQLHLAEGTPTLELPGGGLLIGELFASDGTSIDDRKRLPSSEDPARIRKHILDEFWGEYVLLQPQPDQPAVWTFTADPSGGVACVYSLDRSSVFVTSDVSMAVELGLYRKAIDWNAVAEFLAFPHLKTGLTGLVGLRELLPGNSLRLGHGEASVAPAWSPWTHVARENRYGSIEEASQGIRNAVSMVVRSLAETDRSILLELSGGLDSSIVGISLEGTHARLQCSNLVTPVRGADERQYAQLIATQLGAPLEVVELPLAAARLDFEPPSQAVTPRIGPLQYAINRTIEELGDLHGVTSYFTGGGGDTVFCYLRSASPAADAFREGGCRRGIAAVRDLSDLHQCTHWKSAWLTARKLFRAPKPPCSADNSFLARSIHRDGPVCHPWFSAPDDALPGDRERISDLAATQVFREGAVRGTRRRLRMPLLSQPVMQACLRTPTWMWIAGGQNRAAARIAFGPALPPAILNRRSKGTFIGYLGTVFQQSKSQFREQLTGGRLMDRGLLDMDALRELFNGNQAPRDRTFTRMLELSRIENWVRHQ